MPADSTEVMSDDANSSALCRRRLTGDPMSSSPPSPSSIADPPPSTDWKSIIIVTLITFLTSVEMSIAANGDWMYMITVDSETTSNFNGIAASVTLGTNALSVLLFAAAYQQFRSVKVMLIAGRILSFAGCILYLSVEFFPYNRRVVLLASYIIFALGAGPSPLLRAIISRTSSEDNRTKAFAAFNLADILANLISPLVQLAFSAIHYPGATVFANLRFNVYTAPTFVALILNIACLLIVGLLFHDPSTTKDTEGDHWTMASLRRRLLLLKDVAFSWPLLIVLILQRAFLGFSDTMLSTSMGPLYTTTFALTGPQVVQLGSISQLVISVIAIGLSILFVLVKMGRWISNRVLYLVGYLTVIIMYISSYPWPMWSSHLQPYNETTKGGCNPEEYSWCDNVLATSLWTFVPVLVLVMGFSVPAINISFDSMYSKALGDIDQGPMQSMLTVVQNLFSIAAPLCSSAIFTAAGMPILWIVNFSITTVAVAVWIAIWKPLGKCQ